MKRNVIIILLGLLLILVHAAYGKTNLKDMKGKKSGPIHIVSDRLDAYNEQKLAVFTGNVVATEGDKVIKCDHLLLYNKKDEDKAKQKAKGDEDSGDIDRIEARGNVRITQGTKIVTGENAVYLNDDQKIIVTGNPVMKDGDNIIKGDKIIVLLDEDRGVVESGGPKRVSATFYPEDKNKKPKKEPAPNPAVSPSPGPAK